ncbi:MAG: hypothetical protein WD024_04995 [Bacillota bacterium]
MKKLVGLLLVVAFLFGFGFTVSQFTVPAVEMMADPGYPLPDPPPVWPPCNENGIGPITI